MYPSISACRLSREREKSEKKNRGRTRIYISLRLNTAAGGVGVVAQIFHRGPRAFRKVKRTYVWRSSHFFPFCRLPHPPLHGGKKFFPDIYVYLKGDASIRASRMNDTSLYFSLSLSSPLSLAPAHETVSCVLYTLVIFFFPALSAASVLLASTLGLLSPFFLANFGTCISKNLEIHVPV